MAANSGKNEKRGTGRLILALALFLAPVTLLWGSLIRGPKAVSATENRTLAQWPALTAESFLRGTFQEALEEAAGDQMIGSEPLRAAAKDAESAAQSLLLGALKGIRPEVGSGYAELTEGYYAYAGDAHRIVERPDEARLDAGRLETLVSQTGRIRGVKKYLYFIENSRSVDFDRMEDRDRYYQQTAAAFDALPAESALDGAAAFRFESYEDYCRLFYQTDHHWNHRGSWRGYQEILELMGLSQGTEQAPEELTLPVVFNGSYARQTRMLCADEPFSVYAVSLPKHTETMNGKRGTYGHLASYIRGKVPEDNLRNHYAYCYGGDYGEIVYDFGDEGRGSLLMLVDSYSNPINGLIASHFDTTYVIDPRYYESWAGVPFDPESYLADHPADALLMMGDILFFQGADSGEGGAE